jgi:hypothetical protein
MDELLRKELAATTAAGDDPAAAEDGGGGRSRAYSYEQTLVSCSKIQKGFIYQMSRKMM